jgi:ubiquinone/menaquinone biosynthesis C-methylase UbiE
MSVRYLPAVPIEGHVLSSPGSPEHPMRVATRRAAGLDEGGWKGELRDEVRAYFDAMAEDWHTRTSPQRSAIVSDALARGVEATGVPAGLVVEVGSGIGTYSPLLSERFGAVVAIDLSLAMLRLAPTKPAFRVQADGSRLPLRDASTAAIVLINAFLFPAEVARVLAPDGVIVWVNSSGECTPIYLSSADLLAALPGKWTGTASQAGEGHWCVLRRTGV